MAIYIFQTCIAHSCIFSSTQALLLSGSMSVLPQFITQFLSTLDKYCVVLLTVLSCDCIVQSKISMLAELTSFMMLHAFPLQNPLTIIPHTLHYDKTHVMSINLSGDNNIGLVWRMIYTSKQF
jgi:hypothetical protein